MGETGRTAVTQHNLIKLKNEDMGQRVKRFDRIFT